MGPKGAQAQGQKGPLSDIEDANLLIVIDIIIDGDEQSFCRYTSGHWLWDEPAQLSRRYVSFNMAELAKIAAQSIGASSCVEIKKVPEGNFNKTFLLTMSDGKEVIAKVPNPSAGRAHFTTASEVATMDFVRDSSHLG